MFNQQLRFIIKYCLYFVKNSVTVVSKIKAIFVQF